MNKTSSFLNGLCAGCSALWRAIFLFRPLAALRNRVARRVRTRSLSRRIAEAFLVLTLVTGGIFSLSAYLSYDYAITHVIRWHMEPIMRLLIAAEEGRTLRKGERLSVDSELLAKELKVKWYVGEAIPDDLRPERSKVRELVRIKRDRYAMTYRDKEGQEYAIVGKIKDLDDLEEVMADIALACVVGSLIGAGLLAYWLSRRLVSPSLAGLSRTVPLQSEVINAVRTPECTHSGLGSFHFARRYFENRVFFLFLRLLRCFSSPGSLRTPMDSVYGD